MSHIPYYGQEPVKTRVEYNKFTDEYFIVIPDDIVQLLNLHAGDNMIWSVENGEVFLTKEVTNDES